MTCMMALVRQDNDRKKKGIVIFSLGHTEKVSN